MEPSKIKQAACCSNKVKTRFVFLFENSAFMQIKEKVHFLLFHGKCFLFVLIIDLSTTTTNCLRTVRMYS